MSLYVFYGADLLPPVGTALRTDPWLFCMPITSQFEARLPRVLKVALQTPRKFLEAEEPVIFDEA